AAQAHADTARYLLLDATGEAFIRRDGNALRWLDAGERAQWLADTPASLLGIAHERPHFLLVTGDREQGDALEVALDARRLSLRNAGLLLPAEDRKSVV